MACYCKRIWQHTYHIAEQYEYEKAIKKGKSGPPSGGCKVLSYNKAALKSAMKSAFDMLEYP